MKTILFTILVCILSIQISKAQWQPDVRLTNDPSYSSTSQNNAWCIAASGNVVHVVWKDNRDGNEEIYYKRSTDGGSSWGSDIRLTYNMYISEDPSISVFGQAVHVVWVDNRDDLNWEIYNKSSTDAGISWGADTRLTNNIAGSNYPSLSASSSVSHVVWIDLRDGNAEIYYKQSTDAGLNWGPDKRLTDNSANSRNPSISVSGLDVHVVWYDFRDGNAEIYYKRSTDGGVSWGTDIQLTSNPAESWSPSISVSGMDVHIVWSDFRDGNGDIYYKRSTNAGVSWGADIQLTSDTTESYYPSVSVSGLTLHVVWDDNGDGKEEIYYKRSTDGGSSWGEDTRLTNSIYISGLPSVTVSNSPPTADVHVVWTVLDNLSTEIYYKRDPTGNITGIENIGSELPEQFTLEQNYPNPFNPSTVISYQLPVSSGVTLKVYDVLGNEVATLVDEEKSAGRYNVNINALKLSSGVYFYKLNVGNYAETKKMVLTK